MGSEENKRNDEHVWASVFVRAINKQYGFDYYLEPERSENSPIDMYAISESGKLPTLELQLTHAVELPFINYEQSVSAEYDEHPAIKAIEHKITRLTEQGADLSRLILIVQGYMNHATAEKVFAGEEFAKYKDAAFEGIYYAAPSMMSGDTDESFQDGYIITIKDAFTKNFNHHTDAAAV